MKIYVKRTKLRNRFILGGTSWPLPYLFHNWDVLYDDVGIEGGYLDGHFTRRGAERRAEEAKRSLR